MVTENAPSEFGVAWQDYRRRVRWFFGVWLSGFVVVGALAELLGKLGLGDVGIKVFSPAWMIAFVVVGVRLQLFKCPRCRRQFFKAWWYYNPFARKFVHCGFSKWGEANSNAH